MERSVVFVTGATSRARLRGKPGFSPKTAGARSSSPGAAWRARDTVAELAAETKAQVFTPLELDLEG